MIAATGLTSENTPLRETLNTNDISSKRLNNGELRVQILTNRKLSLSTATIGVLF